MADDTDEIKWCGIDDHPVEIIPLETEPVLVDEETAKEIAAIANPLDQFTYSIRHRIERTFTHGEFEGRLRLAAGEYIVSATTLDDVLALMTVKADSLMVNGVRVQA